MNPAIALRGVGKRYTKHEDAPALVTGLLRGGRHRSSPFWAVRDVSVEVAPGENVGLIGRNGSGKSTLLQMICGVTAPTEGEVLVRGRIAPLISVGVGFHPELSGRENVYLNAAILGLSRRATDRKLDAIIDFSGVEEFIDTPLKFYSSGMSVRLGFAVAAHSEPEVLLVDEVLAVGDLAFQLKSFDFIDTLRAGGTTVFVVSHNLPAVQRLCPRSLVLDSSACLFDGPTDDAIEVYHAAMSQLPASEQRAAGAIAQERGVVEVGPLALYDESGRETTRLRAGAPVQVRATLRAHADVPTPFAVVRVHAPDGQLVYSETNLLEPFDALRAGGAAEWRVDLAANLPTGSYAVTLQVARAKSVTDATLEESVSDVAILAAPPALQLYVEGRDFVKGTADLLGRFSARSTEPA